MVNYMSTHGRSNRTTGFTIIEALVVLVIVGIVASVIVMVASGYSDDNEHNESDSSSTTQLIDASDGGEQPPGGTDLDWFVAETPWGRIPCVWAAHGAQYGNGVAISCAWPDDLAPLPGEGPR